MPNSRSHKPGEFRQKIKKPGDSVKNLDILVGHFFHSNKFKEHFKYPKACFFHPTNNVPSHH